MADFGQLSQIMLSGQRLGATDESYLVDADHHFLTDTYFPHTGEVVNTIGAQNALNARQSGTETYANYNGVAGSGNLSIHQRTGGRLAGRASRVGSVPSRAGTGHC